MLSPVLPTQVPEPSDLLLVNFCAFVFHICVCCLMCVCLSILQAESVGSVYMCVVNGVTCLSNTSAATLVGASSDLLACNCFLYSVCYFLLPRSWFSLSYICVCGSTLKVSLYVTTSTSVRA